MLLVRIMRLIVLFMTMLPQGNKTMRLKACMTCCITYIISKCQVSNDWESIDINV